MMTFRTVALLQHPVTKGGVMDANKGDQFKPKPSRNVFIFHEGQQVKLFQSKRDLLVPFH